MIWKAGLVLGLVLCVLSDKRPAISEQKIELYSGHHGDLSHIGEHEPDRHEIYAWAYPSYEFSYYVDDPHTHDKKGQHEIRDGDKVTGNYWLIQPDGRKRTVKYSSDHKSGFHADVNYEPHDGYHNDVRNHHGHNDHHHSEHGRKLIDENRGNRWDKNHDRRRRLGGDDRRDSDHDEWRFDDKDDKRDHDDRRGRDDRRDRDDKRDHDDRQGPDNKRDRDDRRGPDNKRDRDDRRGHDDKQGRDEKHGNEDKRDQHDKRDNDEKRDRDDKRNRDDKRGRDDKPDEKNDPWGWIKQRREHKNDRRDDRRHDIGGRRHGYEEHWKHGVLVGWREGIDRDHHRDRDNQHRDWDDWYKNGNSNRRGDDKRSSHEDRRGQHSYHTPIMNFKPLIPYGQRLE